MIGSLLATILVAPLLSSGEGPLLQVRVTASDSGGADDRGLASALSQALVDAGLAAQPSDRVCPERCLRVTVRKTPQDLFLVEVRSRDQVAETSLHLDPSASPFDRAHALAVQVELLADQARSPRRRPPQPSIVAITNEKAPPLSAAPRPPAEGPPLPPRAEPPPAIAGQPAPPAPPPEERLALNVAATSLIGSSGDLLMHGATVGVRLRVSHRIDVRAGITLLRPQRTRAEGIFLRRELLPLQLATTVELPGLPSFRAGVGIEALSISADSPAREMPSAWSPGALGRVEYRHPIRSFSLLASMQVAYHHPSWIAIGGENPWFVIPSWTLAAALGLEFRVL
jgi:hypothetical protein